MDNSQDVRMYLGRNNDLHGEVTGDKSDGPIINPTLLAISQIMCIPCATPYNFHTPLQSLSTESMMFSTENATLSTEGTVVSAENTTTSSDESLTFPPAHAQAKKHAINDLEYIMSFSSSSNSIMSSSPLQSTFKLLLPRPTLN
ncbi:uncharacterized protein EI90DRAFT_3132937 [Cantharellus anzutake]|uniref:uncharacterized protein n=1 Tax=Cantharellus anzutake TaxID=1750568 RepID=UPI001908FE94|nr:uncharacterized protein EI90DRAFT_3132937 [Cantharellus anzutake]KAF8318853.1 hypothetical protein EI90DRAFT_3132937 [Cantharellus anzutake]